MKKTTPSDLALTSHTDPTSAVDAAWGAVGQRFDRFCLVAGVAALSGMMEDDVQALAGNAHARSADQPGYRCGRTKGRLGLHGGKVALARPRMRSQATRQELPLPSWRQAAAAGRLEEWATSPMLINVATREFGRAVRLPEAGISTDAGSGLSKAAVSRRFEALAEARPAEWMASDPSQFDLPVVQVDGLHMDDTLRTAASIPSAWSRQPPRTPRRFKPCWTTCSSAGSTRRSAGCSSSMARGVDGARGRWREGSMARGVDGAKALAKAIRRTLGADIPIQRCQIHKARNITDRSEPEHHAAVRRALRQAREIGDAGQAERLLRNLARRLEVEAPGVATSSLEGLDEILTVTRLGLPPELRRSLAANQHQRVDERRDPAGLPQRAALARPTDGAALDRRRHARSRQELPPPRGLQAAVHPRGRARKAPLSQNRRAG